MYEAFKQVTERGHPVAEVAARLGISGYSLYQWGKRYGTTPAEQKASDEQHGQIRRLKAELKSITEERDVLEKSGDGFNQAAQQF